MSVNNLVSLGLSGVLMLSGWAVAQEEAASEAAQAEAPSVTEYMDKAPAAELPAGKVVVESGPAIECCPICVVGEKAAFSAKRMYRCQGSMEQVLCVDNPADCCCKYYSVPVCVPSCCTGEPVCCGTRVGLLGRGYVTYRWSCGFEATIAFRVHGGVLITYR